MSTQGSPGKSSGYLLKFLPVGDNEVGKGEIRENLRDEASATVRGTGAGEGPAQGLPIPVPGGGGFVTARGGQPWAGRACSDLFLFGFFFSFFFSLTGRIARFLGRKAVVVPENRRGLREGLGSVLAVTVPGCPVSPGPAGPSRAERCPGAPLPEPSWFCYLK